MTISYIFIWYKYNSRHTTNNVTLGIPFYNIWFIIGASVYMYNFAFNFADFNYAFQKYWNLHNWNFNYANYRVRFNRTYHTGWSVGAVGAGIVISLLKIKNAGRDTIDHLTAGRPLNGLWGISRNWNRVRICRFPPFYVSCFGYCFAPQNKEPLLDSLTNLTWTMIFLR